MAKKHHFYLSSILDEDNTPTLKVTDESQNEVCDFSFRFTKHGSKTGVTITNSENQTVIASPRQLEAVVNHNQYLRFDFHGGRNKLMSSISSSSNGSHQISSHIEKVNVKPSMMDDHYIDPQLKMPFLTGTDLDEFMASPPGIHRGSINMRAGEPGCGKSSMTMFILSMIKQYDASKHVLYISTEMKPRHLDKFRRYYNLDHVEFFFMQDIPEGMFFIDCLEQLQTIGYDIIAIDSIAEVISWITEEFKESGQNFSGKAIGNKLLKLFAKGTSAQNDRGLFTTYELIQQITKGGTYMGSAGFVYMIDTLMYLRSDKQGRKYIEYSKNRNGGPTDKKLYYRFVPTGINFKIKQYRKLIEMQELLDSEDDDDENAIAPTGKRALFEQLSMMLQEGNMAEQENGTDGVEF